VLDFGLRRSASRLHFHPLLEVVLSSECWVLSKKDCVSSYSALSTQHSALSVLLSRFASLQIRIVLVLGINRRLKRRKQDQ
jgi:hypothetical protein